MPIDSNTIVVAQTINVTAHGLIHIIVFDISIRQSFRYGLFYHLRVIKIISSSGLLKLHLKITENISFTYISNLNYFFYRQFHWKWTKYKKKLKYSNVFIWDRRKIKYIWNEMYKYHQKYVNLSTMARFCPRTLFFMK